MKAISALPDPRLRLLLPKPSFADAYQVTFRAPALDARQASQAIFEADPGWVKALMALRNGIVRPFGLKAGVPQPRAAPGHIGIFPVLSESPREMVMGLDDRHLDFRVAVTVQPADAGARQITVTTVVQINNALGRIYLTAILPFHRLIARHMLSRAARSWA